ncbi:breast cancer type 2 susceptibility protein isoform X2 [Struthio camelus]|uniref:breast cancer type 2 susceptibility protein isoform X2 n=1 Tax=Struthio camelus TaxID=8801 RepID=UPI0036040218
MAYKPTFFEIFKARCSESDLGPISLNWFEELSSEASPYEPKLLGELDGHISWLDQAPFKTPRAKPATYSQLASTPLIFEEQSTILPPFSSPGKELDQKNIEASKENLISPRIIRTKIDQGNETFASPVGVCHAARNTCRTPHRGQYGSLFCTPKLLEVRTPKRISESLGAEVDPDMSWSSSLATPPTLGATVIIARENDSISEVKQQDERAEIVSRNFFSKHDKYPGRSETTIQSIPEAIKLNAENAEPEKMLDGSFGEMDSFEDTFSMPAKSNGTLPLMPNALDAGEICQITIDKAQGRGDVPSEEPIRRQTGSSQEVKTTSWTEKTQSVEMKDSLLQKTDEDRCVKHACLTGREKESESLKITMDVEDNRIQKSSDSRKLVEEDLSSSSSQWSQLNLSDLDVAHLEMSVCSSPPSDLSREKNFEEKSVVMTKEDAVETSLLNTSSLLKAQKLLSVNLSEKCCEVKNSENNPTLEIPPVKSVSLSIQDPKLLKGCVAEKVSKVSFLDCNSFLIESTNVTEYAVVYNSSFSKHLKATSKSVLTDVLSHPLVCGTISPDNCSDLDLTDGENTFKKSGLKRLNMLSSLKKRSKRFIYRINNTLLYQEEKIQKELTCESPAHPTLPSSEFDSFKSCHKARDDDQGYLLSAERKHLQSNIKEKNVSTCTIKMDIMDNSSYNAFNSRLKQQELKDMVKNAREHQPVTSLKCLEVSNTWNENMTESLNSERISNIKRKVLTSACLMARKRSRLLPEGYSLEKEKEDMYMSINVNDGAIVPQGLKGQLAPSSAGNSECLIVTQHDTTSLTNSSFNNTSSQITFDKNKVSSDCCNKISTEKKHATDQLSAVECREILAPLRIKGSENCNTELKQGEEIDIASFSEIVADNQETKSMENNENLQATACNTVGAVSTKELLDSIDDNSLNEVISGKDKQTVPDLFAQDHFATITQKARLYLSKKVPNPNTEEKHYLKKTNVIPSKHIVPYKDVYSLKPMCSNKNPNENLELKERWSGNLNACRLNLSFSGFQTASNKQIKFSEDSVAKGKMLFKDIENECFEASSMVRVKNISDQVKKENMFFSDVESNLNSNLSDSLDPRASFLEPRHTQFIPHKVDLCTDFPGSQQSLQESNQTLTASQEAEIAELSNILEETGSQFEFTQFRKQSNVLQSHISQQFGSGETNRTTNIENISKIWKDTDFCNAVKSENQVSRKYCSKQEDTNKESKMIEYEKENKIIFYKNNKEVIFTHLDGNGSRVSDGQSFPVPIQDSFSNFVGFTSAGGKKINISKAALTRSAELFRDLDDDNYFFKSSETNTRCQSSNGLKSSDWNFFGCLTKENRGKTVCVKNFKSTDSDFCTGSVSHHSEKKYEENISTLFGRNTENWTKRSRNDDENIDFSCTNNGRYSACDMGNSLSSITKHNQNLKISKQFLNQGDYQVEGNLQEDSLDVTCLGDATTTGGKHSLSISSEMEKLVPNQKGQERNQEDKYSPQRLQTAADGDISISDASLDDSVYLLKVKRGERDVSVSENSDKQKTNSMGEADTTLGKNLFVNHSKIKIGSYHHHQMPFQQEMDVEQNAVKGSYPSGFHTASGKKITIADGFLAKAKQFFAEDDVLGKEQSDNFEDPLKKRRCSTDCVKDCDSYIESTAQHDSETLNFNENLLSKETGDQFKKTVEHSPFKQTGILDTVHKDAIINAGKDCERNFGIQSAWKKRDVTFGKSQYFPGKDSDASSETSLSEGEKLFAERDMEYLAKKSNHSENIRDCPVQSTVFPHLMKVSNDLADDSVCRDAKNSLFVECSKNNHSFLLTYSSVSKCSSSHLNCDSKEFNLEHLNESCPYTNCFTNTTVNAHQEQSLAGGPEDETNLTTLEETSCSFNAEKHMEDLKPIVISTAKGKAVSVSKNALARVREMFQDNGEFVKPKTESTSKTNQMEVAANSSFIVHGQCPDSAKLLNAAKSEETNSVASHFINVNENAGEKGHRDTNTLADAESVPNSQMQCFEQNIKPLGHLPMPDKQIKQSDFSMGNLGFFSTASGKPVQLSEESLKKARQLFCEMENNSSSGLQEILSVEEDVKKSEMSTEAVPRKTGVILPKERENSNTELILHPAFGFSTASGKHVKVSENAYQRAKAILEDSDNFVGNRLCITNQFSSTKDSGQPVKSLTDCGDTAKIVDKVISASKTEENFSEELELEGIYPAEMKPLPSSHHVKTPEHIPCSKKDKQLTLFKNSFQQGQTSLGEGQQNLEMETKSEAVSCSSIAKGERNINLACFQTPKNCLEVEAVESAKAFMEDDLSHSGVRINATQSFGGRMLDKNFQNKMFGKRHLEGNSSLGEPPIKRQLLPEFDRTKNPTGSLKSLKSIPDGIFKDRRKFIYHVPLKPITCGPFGSTKERQEVKNPTFTLPDQDFKGFRSKSAIFQHCALRESSSGTSGFSTPRKALTEETEEAKSLYKPSKTVKTFIPPFRTKLTFSTDEQDGSSGCDSLISKNMTKERETDWITVKQNIAEAHHPQSEGSSYIQQAADNDLENGNSAMSKMMTNLHCARHLQEMRIKKKYSQNVSSQPGSLYVIKTSARNRISLKTAVEETSPSSYSVEQLYTYGVSKHCIQVNSVNAECFQFLMEEFFSKEYLLAGHGMQLADGGWLIPTDEGKAGKKEFYRALCDTPGVDPKLITEAWVYNHYRWIVWKLAAMEVSFPHKFANRCLTPETVLLQLKYRYDLEIDKSKRSAIKKIMEKDDTAGKTLVLCISKIISLNTIASPSSNNNSVESKKEATIIEVTDGWYGIRALVDPPLKAFLHRKRLTVGQKIIVHGAELVGSQNGCTPLEAPDSLMLKISANSTRCARWHAKLGFHRDPRPFPLPLSSLYSEGGAVGCIDVVIQRTYPFQWMEKTSTGSYVFRNSRAEEREAAKYAEDQQKKLEALFAKVQAEFEKREERTSRKVLRSRIVTRQQIRNLQDGAELYEAIQNASDPGYMEGYLSEDQLKALNAHRQMMNDKKQAQIQAEFKKAVESAEQEELGYSKRDVSTVWKLCVVDYRKQENHNGVMLSIWRPLLDVCSLLKEGSRYRIYQLSASQSKGRSDPAKIQLTATKKTQYLQLPISQEMLPQIFFPRKALAFTSLLDPSFQPPCAEVDLVGVVVSVGKTGFTSLVYLSDENYNLAAVKIWTDLRHLAIEDIVVRCSFISASNLQWQSEFRSEIPVLSAGDLSIFSGSPKENYLQERFNELRSTIENVDSFCSDAESKLMNLLQRNGPFTPNLPKRYGLECLSPSCNSGLFAGHKSLISSSNIEVKYHSPLSNSIPNLKLIPQGSAKISSSATTNEDHPKNSKKRKAVDLLSRIPAPPPLTPICSTVSPSLKKAFQPPRSLGFQPSKSPKEINWNISHVTSCRKLRETVHLPENDLVADEELAMINTQALINTLPEEKKIDCVNETSSTIATDFSDDLSRKNSSKSAGEANNSSKLC